MSAFRGTINKDDMLKWNPEYICSSGMIKEGVIYIIDAYEHSERTIEHRMDTKEEFTRKALISMGWTPPKEEE